MNDFIERLKLAFENLNNRERVMVTALGVVLGVFVLGLPLFMMYSDNSALAEDNQELRDLVAKIADKAPHYAQMSRSRRNAARRYDNRTPPLGSFLEAEARKHGLTVKEANDQPEKGSGRFTQRSVHASFSGIALTPALNLMGGITDSPYPVAIDQIQLEHYKPGDEFNITVGVITFDKKRAVKADKSSDAAGAKP